MGLHARRKRKMFGSGSSKNNSETRDVQKPYNQPISFADSTDPSDIQVYDDHNAPADHDQPTHYRKKKTNRSEEKDDFVDEEITSSSDNDNDSDSVSSHSTLSETAEETKVRLAKDYLVQIEKEEAEMTASSDEDEESIDIHDMISSRLNKDRMKAEGRVQMKVADTLSSNITHRQISSFKGHDLTPTCLNLHTSGRVAYSGSKDASVLSWDVEKQCKISTLQYAWSHDKFVNHVQQYKRAEEENITSRTDAQVLSIACSDDERYVAVGSRDATIQIYDVRVSSSTTTAIPNIATTTTILKSQPFSENTSSEPSISELLHQQSITQQSQPKLVHTFHRHKGPITCLSFLPQTNDLFSASTDRSIHHYTLDALGYIETLYGHQSSITDMAITSHPHCPLTASRDRTIRYWKLKESTHLIYRGGKGVTACECLSAIGRDFFLTGHDNGMMNVWNQYKKKAVVTLETAHGMDAPSIPRGITSCDVLKESDLAVTGSNDGHVNVWKVTTPMRENVRKKETKEDTSSKSIPSSVSKPPPKAKATLTLQAQIPIPGYINQLQLGPKGRFCMAAVGQEPKMGRWQVMKGAKNRIVHVNLSGEGGDEGVDVDE